MKSRLWLVGLGIIALAIVAPIAWFLASPLFINKIVAEEFPAQNIDASAGKRQNDVVEDTAQMPVEAVNREPLLLAEGQFKDGDSFHKGSGQAAVYQLPDGSHVLRFEDFSATNGPDLHVILSGHPAPTNGEEVMQNSLDLGSLKGNIGSQNYPIPAGTDLAQFKSVVIYCQPFHVVFATASLSEE